MFCRLAVSPPDKDERSSTMTTEPAGTAVSGAPPEAPTVAAEILIVLIDDTFGDGTADSGSLAAAGRNRRRGRFAKLGIRRSQRSE